VRETHIGNELKDMAQEVVRFGERCVQAGRDWLNERREDMSNRNYENRRDPYQPGPVRGQHEQRYGQREPGTQFDYDYPSDRYAGGRGEDRPESRGYRDESNRARRSASRNQPYGNRFDERAQNVGWDQERYQADYNQDRNLGAAYRHPENIGGQREFGTYGAGPGEYYGSDYDTYGRGQGYGEGSGYTRPPQDFRGEPGFRSQYGSGYRQPGYGAYGGESAGSGGRTPMYGASLQSYPDEGEMSGYRAGPSGRYGSSPYQSNRGRGPKNYTRSDERILEEINERLTDDDDLDATEISVRCSGGTITLEGTVEQRWMKHRAEDIADACSGVKEVDNRIQVIPASASRSHAQPAGRTGKTAAGTQTTGTPSQH
jgi:hypothetical protein